MTRNGLLILVVLLVLAGCGDGSPSAGLYERFCEEPYESQAQAMREHVDLDELCSEPPQGGPTWTPEPTPSPTATEPAAAPTATPSPTAALHASPASTPVATPTATPVQTMPPAPTPTQTPKQRCLAEAGGDPGKVAVCDCLGDADPERCEAKLKVNERFAQAARDFGPTSDAPGETEYDLLVYVIKETRTSTLPDDEMDAYWTDHQYRGQLERAYATMRATQLRQDYPEWRDAMVLIGQLSDMDIVLLNECHRNVDGGSAPTWPEWYADPDRNPPFNGTHQDIESCRSNLPESLEERLSAGFVP